MKIIICKRNFKWLLLFIVVIAYGITYIHQCKSTVRPDIRYYDTGTVIENAGIEYKINGKIYDADEFMKEFDIEKQDMACLQYDYDVKIIVVEKNMTRVNQQVDENINSHSNMKIYSKYWHVGMDIELTEKIQKNGYIPISDLDIGETTSMYQVYTIASCNLCERLWNRVKQEKVYYEFVDNKQYNYVRRVKILN